MACVEDFCSIGVALPVCMGLQNLKTMPFYTIVQVISNLVCTSVHVYCR